MLPPITTGEIKPSETQVEPGKASFSDMLGGLVKDVNQLQQTAEHTTDKLLTGELEDVHQVVVAMEEAQTSFRLLMEVRNKMVDAYREVMKMQV
jgi:flagellar hook-basal body complex protein FliE